MVAAEQCHRTEILIADDDPICRHLLNSSLDKWGFDVQSVADGEESCRALLSQSFPSLAIIDWNMPKLDGIDVCRAIRQHRSASEVYILILTSRTSSDDLARALEAGANDFISKPFDAKELRARLMVGQRLVSDENTALPQGAPPANRAMDLWMDAPPPATTALADSGFLTPVFDPKSLKFNYGVPSPMLRAWQDNGTLQKVLLDSVQVCPKCRALPSFRFGCASCGSGCVTNERLIHHFACAHVAQIDAFDNNGRIACPKCRMVNLIVGSDFEYLTGPYRCLDCQWSAAELEHIAHCLACNYRFPASESVVENLVAYHSRGDAPMQQATIPQRDCVESP